MDTKKHHHLLERQVNKYLKEGVNYPSEIYALLNAVNDSYNHFDEDRALLERAMDLNSSELEELLEKMRIESTNQKMILNQLRTMLLAMKPVNSMESSNDLSELIGLLEEQLNIKEQFNRELIENEHNLTALIENTDDIILSLDLNYRIITFNSHLKNTTIFKEGCTPKKGVNFLTIIHDHLATEWKEYFEESFYKHKIQKDLEYTNNGKKYFYDMSFNAIIENDKVIGTTLFSKDITEKKEQQLLIERNLAEKDVLLKEIHHRVKNNLQVIQSLLNLQSNRIQNTEARQFFEVSKQRIHSMALIHEMLYGSSNLKYIDYKEYINQLVNILVSSYHGIQHSVNLDICIDDILLDIEIAVPLGLIINELVTNSLKYGISKNGTLKVKLINQSSDFILEISDNGPGFKTSNETSENDTLGLKLVDYLLHQINGQKEFNSSEQGTSYLFRIANALEPEII